MPPNNKKKSSKKNQKSAGRAGAASSSASATRKTINPFFDAMMATLKGPDKDGLTGLEQLMAREKEREEMEKQKTFKDLKVAPKCDAGSSSCSKTGPLACARW
jgi:hypothetical protein